MNYTWQKLGNGIHIFGSDIHISEVTGENRVERAERLVRFLNGGADPLALAAGRKYSVQDIDGMRVAVSLLYRSSKDIEDKLRSYMLAGTDPAELYVTVFRTGALWYAFVFSTDDEWCFAIPWPRFGFAREKADRYRVSREPFDTSWRAAQNETEYLRAATRTSKSAPKPTPAMHIPWSVALLLASSVIAVGLIFVRAIWQ